MQLGWMSIWNRKSEAPSIELVLSTNRTKWKWKWENETENENQQLSLSLELVVDGRAESGWKTEGGRGAFTAQRQKKGRWKTRHRKESPPELRSSSCRCSLQLLGSDSLLLISPLLGAIRLSGECPVYPGTHSWLQIRQYNNRIVLKFQYNSCA